MHTCATALDLAGVTVPDHLLADAAVPLLTGPQAQGDLLVVPAYPLRSTPWRPVPRTGCSSSTARRPATRTGCTAASTAPA